MKSVIVIKEEQGYVKKIVAEFTPSDFLVVNKALKLLAENEKVNELDRRTAKDLSELMVSELGGGGINNE